ncbi:hypothetical protein AAMO2058_001433300 [Amorphochlora amoebiformis]
MNTTLFALLVPLTLALTPPTRVFGGKTFGFEAKSSTRQLVTPLRGMRPMRARSSGSPPEGEKIRRKLIFALPALVVGGGLRARGDGELRGELERYASPDGEFVFSYPREFKRAPKLLKTHQNELFLRSTQLKKYNVGITIDPVTIKTLKDFGTVHQVAENIIKLEREKEGVMNAELKEVSRGILDGNESYFIDYTADSTRGNIRYFSKLVVDSKQRLYVLTIQAKQDDFSKVKAEMEAVIESFHTQSPTV